MNLSTTPLTPANPNSSGGRLVTAQGTLPLTSTHLDAEATGSLARVTLTQRFRNPHAEPLHVTYLLPLPSDGAVSAFSFQIGERRIVGEVDRRASARERFEVALAEGRTAALVEEDRTSLFTQEIGNIPPGEEVVAEIVIDQPLRWLADGRWEWRFPTVVAPRYQSAGVSDSAKLTVDIADRDIGTRTSLALAIASLPEDAAIESPSHRTSSKRQGERAEVRFENAALDRDVVVRWEGRAPEVGAKLTLARPSDAAHSGDTFGLLSLVPPRVAMTSTPRDLLLLLDISGSMGGRPLDQVKRVALALIDTLSPSDRIEMIAFSSRPQRFRPEAIVATKDGKASASEWVQSLRAGGGTEMHAALLEALRPLRDDAQRQIVLMTDGYIGFEQQIVSTLMSSLPAGVRLHTLGVSSAPNRTLTQHAARAGKGAELIVGLGEDAERAAARLVAHTRAPIVTEVTVSGSALVETAPTQLPDLFAAGPASISLRLRQEGGTLRIEGRTATGRFERELEVPALTLGAGSMGVVTRFGREKVADLEMQTAAGSPQDKAIEETGLAFSIATRLTSWIAATKEATVGASDPKRRVAMPHALPAGISIEGLGLRRASRAVTQTGVLREMRAPMSAPAPASMPAPQSRGRRRRAPVPRREGGVGAPSMPPVPKKPTRRKLKQTKKKKVEIHRPMKVRELAAILRIKVHDLLMALTKRGASEDTMLSIGEASEASRRLGADVKAKPIELHILLRARNAAALEELRAAIATLSTAEVNLTIEAGVGDFTEEELKRSGNWLFLGLGVNAPKRTKKLHVDADVGSLRRAAVSEILSLATGR
ncbi:MAG: VIT domain-containing protein [Myxococcota bacterium]